MSTIRNTSGLTFEQFRDKYCFDDADLEQEDMDHLTELFSDPVKLESEPVNDGDNEVVLYYLGLFFCIRYSKNSLAEKYFLASANKGYAPSLYWLGRMCYLRNNNDLAEKYLVMALDKLSDIETLKSSISLLTTILSQKGSNSEKYLLNFTNNKVNDDGFIYSQLGSHYKASNPYIAEKYYLMAIEKNNYRAMNSLANLYESQNKLDKAEEYYVMQYNRIKQYSFDIIRFYIRQNKFAEAEKYASNNNKMVNLGNYCAVFGKNEMAKQYYQAAINNGEELDNISLHYMKALK